jgi:diguanylate cyclase (GGDEF)-like protein
VVPGAPSSAVADLLGGLLLQAAFCGLLVWRAVHLPQERIVRWRLAIASMFFSVAVAASSVLSLAGASPDVATLPVAWAPVLTFPLVHAGLVRWNRSSGHLADPNDVINGVSAVLAAVAILNVVVSRTGSPLATAPWWEVQALLAQVATGLVLLGTVLSVLGLGSMRHDPRPWLVAAATAVGLTADAATVVLGGMPDGWLAVADPVAAALVGLAAALRPARSMPRPADPAASTIGSFVVIVASTAVLVIDDGATPLAGWCAALAVIGAGVRLLVNVRELAQLAVTRREALTDELTRAANRRAVLRRVRELCDEQVPMALALLDLDKFKEVNGGLGHSAGDQLLRLVAARLQPLVRSGDLLGRLGGDEFAVVAPIELGARPDEAAAALGRRLSEHLAETFQVSGMSIHVAASIGMAWRAGRASVPGDGGDPVEVLLQQADAAMYDAKRSGTGVAVYDSARHAESSRHLALVEELRTAIDSGQLVLHHQPQVDVATGRVVGVEALVRWAHPLRGLLKPADFLPLAEVRGLMRQLTDEVLRLAVAQAGEWQGAGRDLRVSVNLSASNLLDTDLPRRVAGLLRRAGVPPEQLVLEVTESVLLSDPERSLAVVARLADLGVAVSIDDFGTGYSSLAYLRDLPVAELKLDRSFTVDLLTDARTEAIVASTVALAHRLGLRVVAEGVEHAATLDHLAYLGCDESQGYLHSAPLPADRLDAWLEAAEGAPRLLRV